MGLFVDRMPGKLCPGGRIEMDVAVMFPLSSVGCDVCGEDDVTVVVGVVSCNKLDADGEVVEEHAAVTTDKITTKPSPVMSGITFLRIYFICKCLPQSY